LTFPVNKIGNDNIGVQEIAKIGEGVYVKTIKMFSLYFNYKPFQKSPANQRNE
jgi:hypothetical protein